MGQSGGLFITPDNVESLASFIAHSAVIEERAIRFGTGTTNELLLEVPLGFIEPHATIRVTIGLDDTAPTAPARDHDPTVGISDGTKYNEFWITDVSNYGSFSPCHPPSGSHDGKRVTERTHAPAQATMIFKPIHRYGACYLPLDGGYMNTATFTSQLDLKGGINLTLRRNHSGELYRIYYFLVEIFH